MLYTADIIIETVDSWFDITLFPTYGIRGNYWMPSASILGIEICIQQKDCTRNSMEEECAT